jgi:hypothetical protein
MDATAVEEILAEFVAEARYQASHPDALAVYCSDGRFTQAVEELLAALGHARLDTLTIPGGPGLLNLTNARPSERDVVGRAVSFLIRGHHLRHVVLLAHEGCGYYRDRYPSRSPIELRALQLADLRAARKVLAASHDRLQVRIFYTATADGRVRFEEHA